MYYNTNKEVGKTLRESEKKTVRQEDLVYDYMRSHWYRDYTPSEIRNLILQEAPLTSIRRALSNLTKAGKIIKTKEMREGEYGKMTHTWQAKKPVFST